MRPLLSGWLLSFAAWGLVALVMAADGVVTRGDAWGDHLRPSVAFWLPWAVLTPLVFRLVARLPLERGRLKFAIPIHLLACVVLCLGVQWWKDSAFHWFRTDTSSQHQKSTKSAAKETPSGADQGGSAAPNPKTSKRRHQRSFNLFWFVIGTLPFYIAVGAGAHAALFFRRDQQRAAHLARARLEVLRMQLQPHFLFNSLNTIASLVHDDPEKADELLTGLSELLRTCLDTAGDHEVPLADEAEFIERYLELMHARFEERLRYKIDIPAELSAARVPAMFLQPLVENAVEHGLRDIPAGGSVTVRAHRDAESLRVEVSDDGAGIDEPSAVEEGIGITNTRERLATLYGKAASLSFGPREGGGTTVQIALPYGEAEPPQA